ncbi:MAG: helix-turn-helix transcriptional regulator [Sandaracinus sp.]
MGRRGMRLQAPEAAMIAVADAGYSLAADDETWLRGVLEAARPVLDHGSFVHGWIVDVPRGAYRSCAAIQLPEGADLDRDVRHHHLPMPRAQEVMLHRASALATATATYGLQGEALARVASFPVRFPLADCIGLISMDTSGIGAVLIGGLSAPGHFSATDQRKWDRVASHLAAALRLRERLRALPAEASLDAADAVLDPRTRRAVHASSEAESHLETIRDAAEVLAARHGTSDPARLVAAWRALVAGRWSLVDTFDTDRKRYFVLRKNEPAAPGPDVLSASQRAIAAYVAMGHSNKAIAYHLGVSESAISRALDQIVRRLGLPSRAALAQLAAALGAHPDREAP